MNWEKKQHQHAPLAPDTEMGPMAPDLIGPRPACESAEEQPQGTRSLESFLQALLPLVGVSESMIKEYPGLIGVVPGPEEGEVTVQVDMAPTPYAEGGKPSLQRVVTLTVRLDHDYRLMGNLYYCINCDLPGNDTVH